jgi:enterochelin esterase-like enzyme
LESAIGRNAGAATIAYRIYLPPCYGADGRVYPTLYMLPGNIHTDSIWDELGLDETAEGMINSQTLLPLLIVMVDGGPLALNTSGGPASYEGMVIAELIPHIESRYCAWREPAGRAIGGLSRGGYWALEIAFRHAGQFASVGGHSAALVDTFAGPDLNPQQTGLTNDLGNLRIYFDIGSADPYLPQMRRLHEEMEAAGRPHTWQLNDGGHEEAYWAAHTADYLTWYSAGWPRSREKLPGCSMPS